MSKTRASIFGDDDMGVLDVTGFAPKTGTDDKAPPAEQVRAVAQAANFKSREPTAVKVEPKAIKRSPAVIALAAMYSLASKPRKKRLMHSMPSPKPIPAGYWVTRSSVRSKPLSANSNRKSRVGSRLAHTLRACPAMNSSISVSEAPPLRIASAVAVICASLEE